MIPIHPIYRIRLHSGATAPATDEGAVPFDDSLDPVVHVPPCRQPRTDMERRGLSAWMNTHQALFMTLDLAIDSGLRAAAAFERSQTTAALRELRNAQYLRAASAAYTSLPPVTREVYESFVRPSMIDVDPGFSGVSSPESIRFEKVLRRLKHLFRPASGLSLSPELVTAYQELRAADRFWWQYHGRAMKVLVGGTVSLARREYQRKLEAGLQEDSVFREFKEHYLRNPSAIADYDHYFGVARDEISATEFWHTLDRTLRLSASYIESEGPLAEAWKTGSQTIQLIRSRGGSRGSIGHE